MHSLHANVQALASTYSYFAHVMASQSSYFQVPPPLPAQKASKLDSAVNMVQKQTENEILFLIKK